MKSMIQKQSISQNCLMQRIILRPKIINKIAKYSLLVAVIAFVLFIFSEQICLSKEKMPLLISSTISKFSRYGFYNNGRQWYCSTMLEPYIQNEILFVSTDGSEEGILLYTTPGEANKEKKIIISGQKYLVIEFDKPIKKHIVFLVKTLMEVKNELETFEHAINCFNKSIIKVSLSPKGKTIHHLMIIIKGEKSTFGIKSIFLE